jgi:ankyrin repeat protein
VASDWNALHVATWHGYKQIVAMLLSRGAVLEARSRKSGETALLIAAVFGHLEVCLLLIAKGADLRVSDNDNHSALSHYGVNAYPRLAPWVKAQFVAELKAAFRAGCHLSQVQR